jgi:hypothetical protein
MADIVVRLATEQSGATNNSNGLEVTATTADATDAMAVAQEQAE